MIKHRRLSNNFCAASISVQLLYLQLITGVWAMFWEFTAFKVKQQKKSMNDNL